MSIFLPNLRASILYHILGKQYHWSWEKACGKKSPWISWTLAQIFLFKSPVRSVSDSVKICICVIKWQIRYKETGKAFNHLMEGNRKRKAAQNNTINKDKFTPETAMDLIFYIFILSLTKSFLCWYFSKWRSHHWHTAISFSVDHKSTKKAVKTNTTEGYLKSTDSKLDQNYLNEFYTLGQLEDGK